MSVGKRQQNMPPADPTRLLSVQSHVVSGYVGNRAATFPLQILGYDVDVINTVQFSNHTGYGHTNGYKVSAAQLNAIFEGLWTNGLVNYARLLTGYIPGAEALAAVSAQAQRMKEEREDLIYLLDPVMGDIGTGLYVSPDVVPVYKDMLRMATIITPNQFEAQLLSGVKITSLETLHEALQSLHLRDRVPHVVVSSVPLPGGLVASLGVPPPPKSYTELLPETQPPWYDAVDTASPEDDVLVCFASSCTNGRIETYAFALPTIRGYFSGVGDLFSALTLGHYENPDEAASHSPLVHAVSKALLGVQQVLLKTHLYSLSVSASGATTPRPLKDYESVIPSDTELDNAVPLNPADPKRKAKRMRIREMRVVPERRLLLDGGEGWPGTRIDWDVIRR